MWELLVKFYLEKNEDYNIRDSISDSSEELLPRGRWERSVYVWFWWRGVHTIKHIFLQKVAASLLKVTTSHKEQVSQLMILVLF